MDALGETLSKLILACVRHLGFGWTVGLVILLVVIVYGFRFWAAKQRDKEHQSALDEKERSVQRAAAECRMWRRYFFTKVGGMTDEQARVLVEENDFPDGPSARRAMEKEGGKAPPRTSKVQRKRKKKRRR